MAALVLAPPSQALHVMVDGQFAVWDGHLAVDEEPIVTSHNDLVRRLVGHWGGTGSSRSPEFHSATQLEQIGGNK